MNLDTFKEEAIRRIDEKLSNMPVILADAGKAREYILHVVGEEITATHTLGRKEMAEMCLYAIMATEMEKPNSEDAESIYEVKKKIMEEVKTTLQDFIQELINKKV